ncbi:MAG: hypothetical protein DWQ47_05340 [Acidobacteria bacterium]|nr:MAG: hypothetical protein DWQ32_08890 [Acidobacteriota bacterium]REK01806.1 MAG: hypothetical protein DWQ38_05325 [Acidobacteriota bacterium]REK14762.1 MAG: hypothetical protein DWQ43_14580 [Acidobacteriota bacterium]REK45477.1 MAG: hypothetical protein DWQ47_05340 [Acidobacteriota bacterium]
MKKFITSILFATLFFLGLGYVVQDAGAKFKSDDKAVELINSARQAIGGDTYLNEVRSMTIIGSSTHFFEKDGVPTTEIGATEINFELPNRFSKSVKIGNPDQLSGGEVKKHVDVVVIDGNESGDAAVQMPEGKEGVFVIKKGDGNVEWTSDEDVEFTNDEDKIIIRKDDGTVTELSPDAKHKIRVHKESAEGANVWNTDDGKQVIVEKHGGPHFGHRSSGGEMLRTTMALLATAPEGQDVTYKFAGTGDVDGYPSNIVEVSTPRTSFKLFLDAATNLPRMISYEGHNTLIFRKRDNSMVSKEELIEMKRDAARTIEHQIRLSDFRSVGGLMLPHRWTESAAGKQSRIFDITSYEINPANIADKFGNNKVFVRKMKPEGN